MNHSLTEPGAARNVRADAFVAQMDRTGRSALVGAIERQNVAELERAAIAGRIKEARLEAGLSQPEMAEALGVIPRTFQNYESTSSPRTPWGLMNLIATITGKTTEWLIHGERETPDLSLIKDTARADQLDAVVVHFSGQVNKIEERQKHLVEMVEARVEHDNRVQELLDKQNALLAGQTKLLDQLDRLVKRLVAAGVPAPPGDLGRRAAGVKPTPPTGVPERRRAAGGSQADTA